MASLNQVSIELKVSGERQATKALKDFAEANKRVGSSVAELGRKVSSIEGEYRKINELNKQGVVGDDARRTAIGKLAKQLADLTGRTEEEASAALRSAEKTRAKAEADERAAKAAEQHARAQKNLEGSVLRNAQAVNQAVSRMKEMNRLQSQGVVKSEDMAQAELEVARALARTNGYLKSNGALNTQKALAELKAAQATQEAAAVEARANAERQRAQQSYNQLRASIDQSYAARMRLRQAAQTLRAAEQQGIITREQAIAQLREYRTVAQQVAIGTQFASRKLNAMGVVTQQAGYQIGDFLVQIQSGTNVFVALGQQLTQLVGTFGVFAKTVRAAMIVSGIGIIVPILTAIGAAFMRTSGQMETLETRVSKLDEVTSNLNETFDLLKDGIDPEKYGSLADEVNRLANSFIALDSAAQVQNLVNLIDKIGQETDLGFFERPLIAARALISGQDFDPVAEERFRDRLGFQMGFDQFEDYIKGMQAAAESGNVEEVLSRFNEFLADATDEGASSLTLEGYVIADALRSSLINSAELAAEMNGSAEAARQAAAEQKAFEESVRSSAEAYREVREAADERSVLGIINRATASLDEVDAAQKSFGELVRASAEAYREVAAAADERGVLGIINKMAASLDEVDAAQEGVLNLVNMTKDAYAAVATAADDNSQANVSALQQEAVFLEKRLQIAAMEAEEGENSRNVLEARKRLELEILEAKLLVQVAAEGITEEERAAVEQVVRLTGELIDAENAANNTSSSASTLANEMSRAANEALRFVQNLGSEAGLNAAIARVAGLRAELNARQAGASDIEAAREGKRAEVMARPEFQLAMQGPVGLQQEALSGLENEIREAELGVEQSLLQSQINQFGQTGGTSGGTSGGGATGYAGLFPELAAAYEQAEKLAKAYGEEVKILDSALEQGLITQQEYNSYVAQAQEAYNQSAEAANQYEDIILRMANTTSDAIGQAMMDIVTGTKSASDAFSDMAQIILKKAFELLVINPIINSIFGGSGLDISGFNPLPSILDENANGGVFQGGAKVQAFATGGVVGSPTFFPMANGNVGLMGEAGPEAIMPLKRGKGGRLGVEVSGEQGNVVINQTFAFQANGDDSVKRIIASEAPKIAALTQKQMLDARRRGGVVRDTFA